MPNLNTTSLYINVLTKSLVSISGSPVVIPPQFYGDVTTFYVSLVQQANSNANQGYTLIDMTGYTMNLTMAGTPNATSPPTPFAALDGMLWDAPNKRYVGAIDLTQTATQTFVGANAFANGFLNIDVFDSLANRTTLLQVSVVINASIDTVVVAPGTNVSQLLTRSQALNMFVLTAAVAGKHIDFMSQDGTRKESLTLGNDGSKNWTPIP